jgi:protein phosphatase
MELAPGKDVALCVICDGMGGAKAGNIASGIATEGFMDFVKNGLAAALETKELSTLLKNAASYANNMVYEVANSEPDCLGMGTTLVGAVIAGETAFVINVGDSRAYLIRSEGIKQISKDHSLVEDMIDRGDLTREEAGKHPDKNLITRALGVESTVSGDVFEYKLKKGDLILLCSDGLTNLVDDQTIFEYASRPDKSACCQSLIELTLKRGAPDNVTVLILEK